MTEAEDIADDIWRRLEGEVEALYLAGSRAIGAEERHSDYDFFGLVNRRYSFDEERKLNQELSHKYDEVIRFRGISLQELNGGEQKGVITKHVPLPVILKSFSNWKHLKGKEYSLEDFEIKPASPEEEAEFYITVLKDYRKKAEQEELPFPFEDYVKNVIRLIGAEEQIQGGRFTQDFTEIVDRCPAHVKELGEMCLRFRGTGDIDRSKFFLELDKYLENFEF